VTSVAETESDQSDDPENTPSADPDRKRHVRKKRAQRADTEHHGDEDERRPASL
jgi:hypothetical protein